MKKNRYDTDNTPPSERKFWHVEVNPEDEVYQYPDEVLGLSLIERLVNRVANEFSVYPLKFHDMSVLACAARYEKRVMYISRRINQGSVSASMSGIDAYPTEKFHDLKHDEIIKVNLTWNGRQHISRPSWREEFEAYCAAKERERHD